MARLIIETCDLHGREVAAEVAAVARNLGARVDDVTAGIPLRLGAAVELRLAEYYVSELHRQHDAARATWYMEPVPEGMGCATTVREGRTGRPEGYIHICRACKEAIDRNASDARRAAIGG